MHHQGADPRAQALNFCLFYLVLNSYFLMQMCDGYGYLAQQSGTPVTAHVWRMQEFKQYQKHKKADITKGD